MNNNFLPSNFEDILLKYLIIDKAFFLKTLPVLESSIFNSQAISNIYSIMRKYYDVYKKSPESQEIITLAQDIPNPEIRLEISNKLINLNNINQIDLKFLDDYTIQYIKNQLFEKALVIGADFIDKKTESSKQKAKELIDKAQTITLIQDLGDNYLELDNRLDYYQNPEKGLKYKDFTEFNKFLGEGILNGTLNVFLAPPGIGKSMMISFTISDFLKQKKNILLVSMEMSNYEFMKRLDANLLDIPIKELSNPDFKEQIKEKFEIIKSDLGNLYLQNYQPNTFSANTLSALLDMYRTNGISIDCVFLDYLGIMKSDKLNPNVGLYSYIKSIGEEVRGVAKQWNIPVFSASQLNRGGVNKDSKEVDNSLISDSMGTAMTADLLVMLLQTEAQKEVNQITFKITKNRYTGLTREFKADVDYQKMRFINPLVTENKEVIAITEPPKEVKNVNLIDFNNLI